MPRPRIHRVSEKVEQQHGVQLLRSIGWRVYVLGNHRRRGDFPGTMQTKGLPDVQAFSPSRLKFHAARSSRVFLCWECKGAGGRLRPEQAEFRALCAEAGVEHVVGDLTALIAWLISHEYVKADSFPHYRQPRTADQS